MFGARDEVDPVQHLIGTAAGWGGNPRQAALHTGVEPEQNDGRTAYRLTVREVPVTDSGRSAPTTATATSRGTRATPTP